MSLKKPKLKAIFEKYGLVPLLVLVLLGAFYQPDQARAQEAADVITRATVTWSTPYNYVFNPTAEKVLIGLGEIKWKGVLEQGGKTVDLVADKHYIKRSGGETSKVLGYYYGIAPVTDNKTSWSCDGVLDNRCEFSVYRSATSGGDTKGNPFVLSGLEIPVSSFPNRDSIQRYKIVPVLKVEGTDFVADTGPSNSFSINWQTQVRDPRRNSPTFGQLVNVPTDPATRSTYDALTRVAPAGGVISGEAVASDINTSAFDNPLTGIITSVVNIILAVILGIIRAALWIINGLITIPILESTLGGTEQYVASVIPDFIRASWIYVRDVMNLLFILFLIFAGIATMLRIGEYGMKKTISRVVIIALAVNFSLLAGQIILNFAQILTFTFIDPGQVGELTEGINTFNNYTLDFSLGNALQGTAMLLFSVVYEVGISAVLLAFAALLLIRLAAVWFLLILAPAAYVLYLFEPTAEYLKEWWHKFLQYAFYAPFMAFFLAVITRIIKSGYFMNAHVGGATGSIGSAMTAAMQGAMVIVMLVFALRLATKMGIAGAETVVGAAEGAWKFGSAGWWTTPMARKYTELTRAQADKARKQGTTWGTVKAGLWTGAGFLNLKAAKKAWDARSEHLEHEAYAPAVGEMHDFLNRVMPTEWRLPRAHSEELGKLLGTNTPKWLAKLKIPVGMEMVETFVFDEATGEMIKKKRPLGLGRKTFYGRIGMEEVVNDVARELNEANLSEEERVELQLNATSVVEMQGMEKALIANRHEDGLAITKALAEAKTPEEIGAAHYDSVEYLEYLQEHLSEHGTYSREQVGEMVAHMVELGEKETKLRVLGSAVYEWDRKFRLANDFSGLEKLSAIQARNRAGKDGRQRFQEYMRGEVNITDDNNEYVIVGKDGAPVERYKIETYEQLETAMTDIEAKAKAEVESGVDEKDRIYSNESGNNLRYELTGARKFGDAYKRIMRGNTERWAEAIEPAAFLQQYQDGWRNYTSYGRRLMKAMSPATVVAFRKGRRAQARALNLVGLKKGEDGGLDLQNINYDLMVETISLNADFAQAALTKAEISKAEAGNILEELNRRLAERNMVQFKLGSERETGNATWLLENAEEPKEQPPKEEPTT